MNREPQVRRLWPQVAIRAGEGHAEDGRPLPLPDGGGHLQLAVHLHLGLPGGRACVCLEREGNMPRLPRGHNGKESTR